MRDKPLGVHEISLASGPKRRGTIARDESGPRRPPCHVVVDALCGPPALDPALEAMPAAQSMHCRKSSVLRSAHRNDSRWLPQGAT
jgi:hypothetical protein